MPDDIDEPGNDFEARLTYLGVDQPWLAPEDNLRNRAAFTAAAKAIHLEIAGATSFA